MLWSRRIPQVLEKSAALIPQTTSANLFTITGGKILLMALVGEVVVAIGAVANATKIKFTSITPAATVDLSGTNDITGDAAGTLYSIVGVLATAMVATTGNLVVPANNLAYPGLILGPGTIKLDCAGSSVTGTVKWSMMYVPLEVASAVASA